MKKDVQFLQWKNPLLPPDEQSDEFDADGEWEYAKRKFGNSILSPSRYRGTFLFSPFVGAMPLHDDNLPEKRHKLWEAITNFDLGRTEEKKIAKVSGVEGCRILSRYRFWLMVGHMFEDAAVHAAIRTAICPPETVVQRAKRMDPLVASASSRFLAWAIVKNGKVRDVVGGESRQDVEAKLAGRDILVASWSVH